ncbi:hypothetical protein BVI434_270019 [Burkholderia vietnamiensis]|nr:hypothetical protein BVI2075_320112 [Burkholderia vietnamiensis]CAG9211217.1 hypothetical protein BVI1335_220061 [Burkholderia vietnamiensis]CAG9212380.1 hypothetical protein BVI434_270019 [Burkholderia vietnamiensis]
MMASRWLRASCESGVASICANAASRRVTMASMTTVIPLLTRDDPFADGNARHLSVDPEYATN